MNRSLHALARPCRAACCAPYQCIVPPYLAERLARHPDPRIRARAQANQRSAALFRASRRRAAAAQVGSGVDATPAQRAGAGAGLQRRIHDAGGHANLPGRLVRAEGDPPSRDAAVNEAWEHTGIVYRFFDEIFDLQSVDDHDEPLVASVHVGNPDGSPLDNAFWNGRQMAYGDGDDVLFDRFTRALDVVGHELSHGVQGHASHLVYHGESGALNEHFADVFGVLIRQWHRDETVLQTDWLIGADLMRPLQHAPAGAWRRGLRHLLEPGTAFRHDPVLGDDPQPAHWEARYRGARDEGGVHLNSGIPNRAFALFARALGGHAWDLPGHLWYDAMRALDAQARLADCAALTRRLVQREGPAARKALDEAWRAVGL